MKTELQWNKLGRVVIDKTIGVHRYYWDYYAEDNTREMTDAERDAFKAQEKAKRDDYKARKKADEEKQARIIDIVEKHCTAYQWLKQGRVVSDGAKSVNGKQVYCSESYYYYHIDDTFEDEKKAEELLASFEVDGYDGRKWW